MASSLLSLLGDRELMLHRSFVDGPGSVLSDEGVVSRDCSGQQSSGRYKKTTLYLVAA